MLERIVAASGIDAFIAAAAPPLGQTARLLVAVGMAGLGGVLGLILGRSLAPRAKSTRPGSREAVHAAFEETSADEVDTFGEDAPGLGLRDRLARLTGQGDGPRDFADLPKLRARDRHPDAPGRKPLTPSDDLAAGDLSADDPVGPVVVDADFGEPEFVVSDPVVDAFVADDSAAADLAPVEPDFARATPAADDGVNVAADLSASDQPLEIGLVDAAPPLTSLNRADPFPAPALCGARLDSLGVVQLTERLAIAMQARRDRDARRRQAAAPASDEAPIVLPSLIAVRPKAFAPAPPAAPELSAAHDKPGPGGKVRGSGYSSLLDLGRPAGSDALTAGEPDPVVVGAALGSSLPGASRITAASDPAENFRALQAALDSIQRLSGTR